MNSDKNIEDIVNRIPKLPTLPGVAMKILEVVKKDELSLHELGNIISTDPALTSEVLKLINSPFFSLPQKVTSVNHAVSLLGLNTVKNLALSFSLVKNFKKQAGSRFDYNHFWKGSIIAAITARLLAQRIFSSFSEDAFFLGLLHNIGMLAFSQCLPDQYDLVVRETEINHCSWHEAENQILGVDHASFGYYMVKSWGLPETFSTPIRYHHSPEALEDKDDALVSITRILYLASLFAEFFNSSGDSILFSLIECSVESYGFTETLDIENISLSIQEQAGEVLPLFEVTVTKEENYFQMIEEARKELINLSFSFLTGLFEQKKTIEELNKKVIYDSLTGLVNYYFFYETLEKEIHRCQRYRFPLSLIIGDIDHFKKINDTWGHLAGDHILKSVAHCLQKGIRDSDAVARYGGEEFAIILVETDLQMAQEVAERLRKEVQQLRSKYEGIAIPVTMSFGVACFSPQEDGSKNDFIQRADQALYKAKQSGRNRCCASAK